MTSAPRFDPKSEDLYERLGVAADADHDRIRKAYRTISKDLHPDPHDGVTKAFFTDMIAGVNEAKDVLLDPAKRARYDLDRRDRKQRRESEDREAARRRDEDATAKAEEEARRGAEEEEAAWQQWETDDTPEDEERGHPDEETFREPRDDQQDADEDAWEHDGDPWEAPEEPFEERFEEPPDERRRRPEPAPWEDGFAEDGLTRDGLMRRVPEPVHRAAVYTLGAWAWVALVAALWFAPIPFSPLFAVPAAVLVPVACWKASKGWALIGVVGSAMGLGPEPLGRTWLARTALEAGAAGPAGLVALSVAIAVLPNALAVILTFAAIGLTLGALAWAVILAVELLGRRGAA